MQIFKNSLFLFFIVLFLGCQKYPENTIWFKDPQTLFKGGKITSFTKSGIDQMPNIRDLYKDFPYNFYGTSIPDVFDLPFTYDAVGQNLICDYGSGNFKFSKNKKEVEITFIPKNADGGANNIFLQDLAWRILKITESGQLKIQAEYNLRIYEIQFN